MKNSFYILLALLFAGCAQDLELGKSATDADTSSATAPQTRARSLDGAVYNETVDAWMIHKADPYTLANFQVAYDNLATGKSKQPLSKSLSAQFDPARKLSPTHYALKIYPKTEEEQWQVEMMEDVQVAYIPFCYTKLTQTEVKKLPQTQTKVVGMEAARTFTFSEKNPYLHRHPRLHLLHGRRPNGPADFPTPDPLHRLARL